MELSRRDFLKFSGAATAGGFLIYKALDAETAAASVSVDLHKEIGECTTVCPYDATGCGFLVASADDRVVNIEGDPEHPVNNGGNCSKGGSLAQLNTVDGEVNPRRLTKPLYRAGGSSEWVEKEWDDIVPMIAEKIKGTRDSHWIDKDGDLVVNRTEAIASVGGAALDNEECALLVKMCRSLGMVYVEHQARI